MKYLTKSVKNQYSFPPIFADFDHIFIFLGRESARSIIVARSGTKPFQYFKFKCKKMKARSLHD